MGTPLLQRRMLRKLDGSEGGGKMLASGLVVDSLGTWRLCGDGGLGSCRAERWREFFAGLASVLDAQGVLGARLAGALRGRTSPTAWRPGLPLVAAVRRAGRSRILPQARLVALRGAKQDRLPAPFRATL